MTLSGDLIEQAREAGREHGRNAASWYFDGNTPRSVYERVMRGIENGDPEILETFPSSPLAGEWAGDPTPATLLTDLGASDLEDYEEDELCSAYEDGFYEASAAEIERVARYHLS